MVTDPGASLGAHALRALKTPHPLSVETEARGRLLAVRKPGWQRTRRVLSVEDCWRIDDEWWRDRPISRTYSLLRLEDDLLVTVYLDEVTKIWYEQQA